MHMHTHTHTNKKILIDTQELTGIITYLNMHTHTRTHAHPHARTHALSLTCEQVTKAHGPKL